MTDYFVDDGGDGSDGLTWAKAYTSINALDTAVAFASGDRVFFGHDHNCQAVNSANLTIQGSTAGLPVIFISATQGSDPPTYQKGTGTQIDTTEGAFEVLFNGGCALYGLKVNSGGYFNIGSSTNTTFYAQDCTVALGANHAILLGGFAASLKAFKNLIVDLTQDGTTNRSGAVFTRTVASRTEISGLTFVNAAFRTGVVFSGLQGNFTTHIDGADFSGFTNATLCELHETAGGTTIMSNCKTAATFAIDTLGSRSPAQLVLASNVGPTDDPSALTYHAYFGSIVSSTSIYRSGGATIEGIAHSWLVTTTANCNEYAPFHSPWIAGYNSSTGSRTFTVFISNDTSDFNNSQVWLEVEFMGTSGSPLYTLASDQRATITTTAAAQDDDTTSVWNGAGPAYTYKQKLAVTATVGEAGQFRARVVTGVASIASSRNFYISPAVFVS